MIYYLNSSYAPFKDNDFARLGKKRKPSEETKVFSALAL